MTEQNPLQMSPGATLDLAWDWSAWLPAADTIVSFDVAVSSQVTRVNQTRVGAVVTSFVTLSSAAPVSSPHRAQCTVTTTGGRVDTRTIYIAAATR